MSHFVSHTKNVKARKDHRCFGCHDIIPKGTVLDVTVCVEDEEIYSIRMCEECEVISKDMGNEEWTQGDLAEVKAAKREQLIHEETVRINKRSW